MRQVPLRSENDEFQLIEALKHNRQKRKKRAEFFVEGVRNINAAVERGWTIKAFLSVADRELSSWANELLQRNLAEKHFLLASSLMEKLSDKEQTSELLAVVAMPEDDLSRIPTGPNQSFVVLDRPSSPGNLGTVIRSCDAFQIAGIVVTGHGVDPYEPRVVRATMGSFFAVPVVRVPSQRELMPWIERLRAEPAGLHIVGTSANASVSIRQGRYDRRCLFLFGNETSGLSAGYRDLCDAMVKIPMGGSASSLNLSCAVSIALYESFGARMSSLTTPTSSAGSTGLAT
ncbi:MAG TPA: TrmH family RNA methyltransferase [Polyangiaceae bacterium]|nr:TrmH family RNA methyltransferase [Polyangiaceae bacterium]